MIQGSLDELSDIPTNFDDTLDDDVEEMFGLDLD